MNSRSLVMSDFMQNAYVFLWAALAVLMFALAIKQKSSDTDEGKKEALLGFILGIFFVFMTVWYGLRAFCGFKMFEGTLSVVFKCVIAAFLLLLVAIYVIKRLKDKKASQNDEDDA